MNNIAIRPKEEMCIYEEKNLNNDLLTMVFIKHPNKMIYVTKEEAFYGVITLGDFVRYLKGKGDLVQTRATFLYEETKDKVHEILNQQGSKIRCVPIVDNQKRIVCEYYKDDMILSATDIELIQKYQTRKDTKLTDLLQMHGITHVILMNEFDYNKSVYNIVFELFHDEKLRVLEMSFSDLVKKENSITKQDTIILDMDSIHNRNYLKELFFKKHKFQYINYEQIKKYMMGSAIKCKKDDYKNTINLIGSIYNTIMICGENMIAYEAYRILHDSLENSVYLCKADDLIWDDNDNCFSYNKESITPDILVSFDFFIHEDYVRVDNKKVLHFNIQSIFSDALSCKSWCDYDIAYNIIPELKRNGILPIVIAAPDIHYNQLEDKEVVNNFKNADYMWDVLAGKFRIDELKDNQEELYKFMVYEDYAEVLGELNDLPLTLRRGYPEIEDYSGKYYTIINMSRYTVGSSGNLVNNKVFLFGPCTIFGYFVKDEDTVASKLQEMLDGQFCVVNMGNSWQWRSFKIRLCEYKPGDIVILMVPGKIKYYGQQGIEIHSIINAFNKVPNLTDNVWDMLGHNNCNTTRYIAEELNQLICKIYQKPNVSDEEIVKTKFNKTILSRNDNSLQKWLHSIDQFTDIEDKRIGCIVMNCNPFTFGHKYLIENAIEKVDYLYIFVVEENKSFFTFEDRIIMVRQGVADLNQNNSINVLPSGSFIISSTTLPGYFEKDQLQEVVIDMTEDVEIFAKKIAPYLNITVRFAGEEPLDKFTNQYNDTMREILPKNGIEFHVIGRKQLDGEPISASRVRKKMKMNDFESIKRMVPNTTYEYLKRNYNNHKNP